MVCIALLLHDTSNIPSGDAKKSKKIHGSDGSYASLFKHYRYSLLCEVFSLSHEFVYDVFTERRGDPEMLELFCAACNHPLIMYQKDGPGPLKRCYLDRIHYPKSTDQQPLKCSSCKALIGTKYIYEKEDRLAYLLV